MVQIDDPSAAIRLLCDHLGWNQSQMGQALGVSRNLVSMMSKAEDARKPSKPVMLNLQRLADQYPQAFGTSYSAPLQDGPAHYGRNTLKAAREAKGYSVKDFAKMAGYSIETYQNIEEGRSSMSEKMARKVARLLDVEAEDLLGGADEPPSNGGLRGTVGADPGIELPPGVKARYVPLLSWAQCGRMMAYDDTAYTHDGFLVINPEDRHTFSVQLAGDSMLPYGPGDVAIVYPTKPPHNGDPVIAKLREDEGGDVMFKMYQASGDHVKLTSLNDRVYPPMDFKRSQFAWIYRVASVVKNFR